MDRDSKMIFEAYSRSINEQEEWTNMDDWVKYFSQPSISNAPVSYKTELAGGEGISYGGNVTVNDIIKRAKNSLSVMGQNPQDKQRILTQTANYLQDYISGSKQLDNQTISDLMDEFAKLDNVEKFVNAFSVSQQPASYISQTKPLPGHGPAITKSQKEAEQFKAVGDEEEITETSQQADQRIRSSLSELRQHVSDPNTLKTIDGYISKNTFNKDEDLNDPILKQLLLRSMLYRDKLTGS